MWKGPLNSVALAIPMHRGPEKLVLVIRAHEGGPRTNVSLANQSRGPKGWSAIQGNVLGNSVDTNKHYRNIG